MRCRLIVEEFSPKLSYNDDSINIVADALSPLDKRDDVDNKNYNDKVEPTLESLSEKFALNKEDILYPTSFKTIMKIQQNEKSLCQNTKDMPKDYSINQFHGASKTYSLIYITRKIVIPKQIQKFPQT